MTELLLLLLPVAAASGWLAARRSSGRHAASVADGNYNPAYFQGLNYLLNEQPDKAIDVFVQMLEVDSETVETHLALGNLFRRRGEVDRAIRIHQNLIARPTLTRNQRAQALLELGQDYMRAGLFDRAESLFNELIEMNLYSKQALHNLKVIHQQEKDWNKCLAVTAKLESYGGESLSAERAHYYCEMAEEDRNAANFIRAMSMVRKAHGLDRDCVRATILQAEMEAARGNLKAAVRAYMRVEQQDPDYIPEILSELIECQKKSGHRKELKNYLTQLYHRHKGIATMLALAELIQEDEGEQAAMAFVRDYLRDHPSLEALNRLIMLSENNSGDAAKETLAVLSEQVQLLIKNRPAYQCHRCGFSAKTLHWQCPGCQSWGSVKPLQDMNGERH